ncbi:MAG: SAM-dependent methyltransferase [Myxococcales bacterium]|nr:SAM-dependent methyltransferase [Myxococcales bacterium]|tara:strand:+ start:221 stop:826 length:606 start_codon:yes stop_codon:yes gene_type:complete
MDVKQHYKELFEAHGNSAKAVQWGDQESQYNRFEVLAQVAPKLGSVVDVGCGLGHLYTYLRAREPDLRYTGLDFVPEFIQSARAQFAETPAQFQVFDLFNDTMPTGSDYLLLSGVFNNLMEDNWGFMTHALRTMFGAAERGVAFNAMSTYVDYHDPELYYVDPCAVFDFCKRNLSKKVTLRHDYALREGGFPFEFVVYCYK